MTHPWLPDSMNTDWRRIPWKTFFCLLHFHLQDLPVAFGVLMQFLWDNFGIVKGLDCSSFWLSRQWVQAPKVTLFLEWCLVFTFLIIFPWTCRSLIRQRLSACFKLLLLGKETIFYWRALLVRLFLHWVMFVSVFVLVWAIWAHFSKMWTPIWSGLSPLAHSVKGLPAKKLSGNNTYSLSGWARNGDLESWLQTIGFYFQATIILWDHHKACGILVLLSFQLAKSYPNWWGRICNTHTEGCLVSYFLPFRCKFIKNKTKQNTKTLHPTFTCKTKKQA